MIKHYLEVSIVLFGAGLLSLIEVAAFVWEDSFVGGLGALLFPLFVPGVWVAMQISGGPHNASEINVFFGVLAQSVVMYVVGRTALLTIKNSIN